MHNWILTQYCTLISRQNSLVYLHCYFCYVFFFFRKKTADGSRVLQETKEENADEYLPIENTFKTWR